MRPSIILFGDSLTQFSFDKGECGWGALLNFWYAAKADVFNRGFSGYTTRAAIPLIDRVFPSKEYFYQPLFLVIWFGANDASLPPWKQHVPLEEYKQNLKVIVKKFQSIFPNINIILLTPPPVDELKNPYGNRNNEAVQKYAQGVIDVSKECLVFAIDLYNSIINEKDWRSFLNDGLHLSKEGNAFVFHQLQQFISSFLPHAQPAQLTQFNGEGPLWGDLDFEHPENSLK